MTAHQQDWWANLVVRLLRHSFLFPFLAHCARNNSLRNDISLYVVPEIAEA